MNKVVIVVFSAVLLGALAFNMSSCSKRDITNPPEVFLDTITGYIYSDTTVSRGSDVSFWMVANKVGVSDYLDSAVILRSINGGPDSVMAAMRLSTTYFTAIYSYQLGDSGNHYKYIFTVWNENRVSSSDSVVVTTN